MKHEIDVTTRAIVRKAITAIASKFNLSRKEAESYYRRNIGTCDVHDALMVAVTDDITEQKEYEKEMKGNTT
jgi:hypothetical protein